MKCFSTSQVIHLLGGEKKTPVDVFQDNKSKTKLDSND